MTPHFHSLVPDGVFVPQEGGVRFEPLPPPTQGEVERLLNNLPRGTWDRIIGAILSNIERAAEPSERVAA